MNEPVFFSVIIPTYNRGDIILKTIDSLLNQTYPGYEIIVVDDGSTDNTASVIKNLNHPRLKYFKKENAERGAARNFGAEKATGQYLNFFDSDDLAYSDHLEKAAQLISDKNAPEIFTLGYKVIAPDGSLLRIYDNYPAQLSAALFEKGNILSCDAVFIKKEIAKAFPFYTDRELAGSEDAVLWMRLAARYEWQFSNHVTSAIVDHEFRSVLKINKDKLTKRLNLFVKYVADDKMVNMKFGNKLINIKLEALSYAALHLVLAGYKKESFRYYIKSLKLKPQFVFSKRSIATLKRILFN